MKWISLLRILIFTYTCSSGISFAQSDLSTHFNPVYWQEQKLVIDLPIDAIIEKSTTNNIQIKGEGWLCSFAAAIETVEDSLLTKDQLFEGAIIYFTGIGIGDTENIESINFTDGQGFEIAAPNSNLKKFYYYIHTSNNIKLFGSCSSVKNKDISTEGVSFDIYHY